MRLVRFGDGGGERPGVLVEGRVLDLKAVDPGIADIGREFFESGGLEAAARALDGATEHAWLDAASLRFGPPVTLPGKIVALGGNYAEHAKESGAAPPENPLLFAKATSALNGPNDDVVIPAWSEKVDIEVELAVVIGRRAKDVSADEALGHVAGYCIMNDVSARDAQFSDGQWFRGKGCDTFAPLGPWLVTTDEMPDTDGLRMVSKINGEILQEAVSSDMTFNVREIVAYVSHSMTLYPGDVISTGTPPGVGVFRDPPKFLKPGDIVELAIDGLGMQRNKVVAAQ